MRVYQIYEDAAIGSSLRAWHGLSYKAKHAIEAWESVNWTGGPLEQHIAANDEVAQEIAEAMKPVIAAIGKPTVHLFRGEKRTEWDGHTAYKDRKLLESWSSDKKVAESFAGLRTANGRSLLKPEITDQQIEQAYEILSRTGFVKFLGQKFKLNKKFDWQDPNHQIKFNGPLYDIYDLHNSYITDTDDPVYHWKESQEWNHKTNEKLLNRAIILEEDIPVERIIWITNNLNSKEYIIRR